MAGDALPSPFPAASNQFNYSYLTWGSTVYLLKIRSMGDDSTVPEAKVTGAGDPMELVDGGQAQNEFTFEVVGPCPIFAGDKNPMLFTWRDGTTTPSNGTALPAICTKRSAKGSLNGEIVRSFTMRPCLIP
jgi:hypothetical protein